LSDAPTNVTSAKDDFDKYSSNPKYHVVVSPSNAKILQDNIDLIKAQLGPLIDTKFKSKENKLASIDKEDPVAWKHDLDDEVHRLTTAAKVHTVALPNNFYFGFSRYLSQSPNDVQTDILSKQLLGVEQLATILINAQVKSITTIRRTAEEDPHAASSTGTGANMPSDILPGYALNGPANSYTAYPFELDFETSAENLRTVFSGLIQSPYIFVVRTVAIQSSKLGSPLLNELDKMAGTPPSSVIDTSPGEVAATTSTRGPQYLFGEETLKVKARIDLIEWNAQISEK
ncbi:MAG TPA: Amuc_1100 family pilus-like protein, partial [Candidatus Methylacidiphilales bacterium]